MTDRGILYVISAPSGTGKTTLVAALTDLLPNITVSISHTTRSKRSNEEDGVNYYFIDEARFEQMVKEGSFLEHAVIFDNHYGTSRRWVEETLAKGVDVILEIDWQGHQQIKKLFPDMISIFILPPSAAALKERLINRKQDQERIIKKRLADVKETVSHIHEFDYVVMNDSFTHAVGDLKTIIEAGRLHQTRQTPKYTQLLQELIQM